MNNIKTYQDLLDAKKKLEEALAISRTQIQADLIQLREEWRPVGDLLSGLGKIPSKNKTNPLLSIAISLVGSALVRNSILKIGSWASQSIVPVLAKGFSKHILNKNDTSVFRKWFGKYRNHEPNDRPVINNM